MLFKGKFTAYDRAIAGKGGVHLCFGEEQGNICNEQRLRFNVPFHICRRVLYKNPTKKIGTWAGSNKGKIVLCKKETRILLSSPDPSQRAREP
ncbi:unnamed protein product [Rhizophagus irregularis]|nr:unnamed protein product [Rhizophagus irregularis]